MVISLLGESTGSGRNATAFRRVKTAELTAIPKPSARIATATKPEDFNKLRRLCRRSSRKLLITYPFELLRQTTSSGSQESGTIRSSRSSYDGFARPRERGHL